MGKNQEKFLCVKAMSRQLEVREGEKLQEDTKFPCVGVQQIMERNKCLREGMNSQIVGRVCMRVRTDSPATPLPKEITASTTSSLS